MPQLREWFSDWLQEIHFNIYALMSKSTVQFSRVWLFVTPWTEACQASLSITNSQSFLRVMSIASVMPSNHLSLYCPLVLLPSIFPSIRVFSNESVFFTSSGQSIGASASASVLPINIQDWFPLGLTGLISLQSKELSRVFSKKQECLHLPSFLGPTEELCLLSLHLWAL